MKLVDKFTLWFIAVVLLVTPVSMTISYRNIKKNLDKAETERLIDVNRHVAEQLRKGETPDKYVQGQPISISKMTEGTLPRPVNVREEYFYNNTLQRKECRLVVTSFFDIHGTPYEVSSFNYVTKADQIVSGMLTALGWKMALIILCVMITARLVSRKVLRPFYDMLTVVSDFNLKQKQKVVFPPSNTSEFRQLNGFLQKMADKAVEDYASLKEFSENASHELQTPLAIIRSKLELLTETGIEENQARLIADMQNAVEKLSRINRSLTLLTKLENHEYQSTERVRLCRITKEILSFYEDRIGLKAITIHQKIDKRVYLLLHPALADMLLNNLIGNAIRHNMENGSIFLTLSTEKLVIKNTGPAPEVPTEELFKRFKKSNQSSESIGLGLAIVKQICDLNGFGVSYTYENGLHRLEVSFPPGATHQEIPVGEESEAA